MTKIKENPPQGIFYLHWIKGLTTFSFAVFFSSLALYLTTQLNLSYKDSNSIVAMFIALNFALNLLSGCVGGRMLSNRTLLFISVSFEVLGLAVLIFNERYLYWGLSLFLLGSGLISTCMNCLLTQQFEREDDRREGAFFVNYCAMNIGFFAGFLDIGADFWTQKRNF